MKPARSNSVLHRLATFLLILSLAGCQTPQSDPVSAGEPQRPSRVQAAAPSATARDLSQDEDAGGHTLRKHVGRTDEQLRQRLRHEHNIAAASTWTDRTTAEQGVGVAITQNREKIDRWLNRTAGHPNLVLDYDAPQPVGRTLRRDADQPDPCAHATIVLKWSGDQSYYVLTSYPECR